MDYLKQYQESHQHPINRALHAIGIPLIVLSLLVFLVDLFFLGGFYFKEEGAAFVLGWVLQFIGHAFEKKPPSFLSNPLYLLVGPVWWFKKMFSRFFKDKNP